MSSDELISDTMYQQHILAHIYLLHQSLLEDCGSENIHILIPKREKLDRMSALELWALFDRLCDLGGTLGCPDAVNFARSTLYLY